MTTAVSVAALFITLAGIGSISRSAVVLVVAVARLLPRLRADEFPPKEVRTPGEERARVCWLENLKGRKVPGRVCSIGKMSATHRRVIEPTYTHTLVCLLTA